MKKVILTAITIIVLGGIIAGLKANGADGPMGGPIGLILLTIAIVILNSIWN